MRRFLFTTDMHVGWQTHNSRVEPIHDLRAINTVLKFAQDFKPHVWIQGGDNLDCGPVSHWLKDKKRSAANLDLSRDVDEYIREVHKPINEIMAGKERVFMLGNHEDWLSQFAEREPSVGELFKIDKLLPLKNWQIIPQGGHYGLGNLKFIHGDVLTNSQYMAAQAVQRSEESIRFGHFHTYQVMPKHKMLDSSQFKTGIAVPCLSTTNPSFLRNKPNQWMQGFLFGYVLPDGTYNDYVVVIVDGKCVVNGKVYRG
jgi:hypothetical protein